MPTFSSSPTKDNPELQRYRMENAKDIRDIYCRINMIETKLDLLLEHLQLRVSDKPRLQKIGDDIKQEREEVEHDKIG